MFDRNARAQIAQTREIIMGAALVPTIQLQQQVYWSANWTSEAMVGSY